MMVLVEAALHSFALGVAAWVGLKAFRAENPHVEMMVWKLVLVASLAMPLLLSWTTVRLPDWSLPALIDNGSGSASAPQAARPDRSARSPSLAHVPVGSRAENSTGATPRPFLAVPGWTVLVTGVYTLISGALLLRLLAGIVLGVRLCRSARPLPMDWTAGAHVRESESVATPQSFASTILLPDDCQSWTALKQRAVMAHEKSHIEHHDFYWLLLAGLHRAVFWFNPLAWWLVRRLGEVAEMLSDDTATEDLGDPLEYADILRDVAAKMWRRPYAIAMARPRTLEWRIERILGAAAIPVRPSAGKRVLVAAGILSLVALSAIGIVQGKAAGTDEPAIIDAQASTACKVERVIEAGIERARDEAEGFAAKKDEELAGEMQRADRSNKRIQQGDNYSWEGHSTRQHFAIDVPIITVVTDEKSFDFVGTGMRETNVFGGKMHLPQFWRKTVKTRLPVDVKATMKRLDIYFDTPSVTIRDNRGDLGDANKMVAKIQAEIPAGEAAIKERQAKMLLRDVERALDESDEAALAEINQAEASALAPLEQQRTQLLANMNRARVQLAEVQKQNEADAAYAPALNILDEAISKMKANFANQRLNASKQIANLRDDYLNNHLTTGSCGAVHQG